MRSSIFSIPAIWILLSFLQTAVVSAVDPEPGYDCDDPTMGPTFIPERKLNEIIEEYKLATRKQFSPSGERLRQRIRNYYFGPPFYEPYLLWPVSPTTKNYDEAAKTPFNVVIDDDVHRVVSVIIKIGSSVKECILRESLTDESSTDDFDCKPGYINARDLGHAAAAVCPQIRVFRDMSGEVYPLRYRGPPYQNSGKQLYYFPVPAYGGPDSRKGNPTEFGVINSDCKIVGAVKGIDVGKKYGHYVHCKKIVMSR